MRGMSFLRPYDAKFLRVDLDASGERTLAAASSAKTAGFGVPSFLENGAPEEIRTPDPQIRSLVLYPAELRARFRGHLGPKACFCRVQSGYIFCRSRKRAIATGSGPAWQGPAKAASGPGLGPRPFVAHAQELHRPVRNRDAEGRADGSFHQMNFAVMGANQFGGDRKPEPTAARPA